MSEFLNMLLVFAPLLAITLLANAAQRRREQDRQPGGLALLAYTLVGLGLALALVIGLLLWAGVTMLQVQPDLFGDAGMLSGIADPGLLAAGLWAPAVLGLAALLRPVRRAVAKLIPIDPDNPVHGVALALSVLVFANLMVTLGMGLANLADLIAQSESATQATLAALWAQQLLTALLGMVGVGWWVRRDLGGVLARLGIVRPTWKQVGIGVGIGLAMVPVVMGLEAAAGLIGITANQDVADLTEQLLGGLLTSPFGILTLGLAAGLGEETLFRGALQPRFGVLFTALLFALVHSNYGITFSTAVVLLMGLVLAWVRNRYNTTTSMVVHAVYNSSLGLLAVVAQMVTGGQ